LSAQIINEEPELIHKKLDIEKSMEIFGSMEIFIDVLRSYFKYTPDLLDKMRSYTGKNPSIDLHEYKVTVHGLKSSSYGIGADEIGKAAEKLEMAAMNGNTGLIKSENDSLITMAESLISELGRWLEIITGKKIKKKAAAPDSGTLLQLLKAAENYKTGVMEKLLAELDSYEYKTGNELIAWLKEKMDYLEYDAIRTRLETLF